MKKARYRLEVYYKQNATESEKGILQFLINDTRKAIEMDIHSLAKQCYCSPATIVRICKKNGFTGFKQLKLALQNDISFSNELSDLHIKSDKDYPTDKVITSILNENIKAIQNTYSLLDFQELNKVVHLIHDSQFIYLYGIGASYLVAKDMQQKFERINKKVFLYEDVHLQLVNSTNVEKSEVAIIISYSGLTKEMIDVANNIKKRGGIIVSITKYGSTKLMGLCDYNLFVPQIEAPLRVAASSSRISQLTMVDIIYHSYLREVKAQSMDKIITTNKLLEKE